MIEDLMFRTFSILLTILLTILLACITVVSVFGTVAVCNKIYQEINKPAISAEAE